MKQMLKEALVTKVSTNRARDRICVFLCFPMIVGKKRIWALEQEIKNTLFPKVRLNVLIRESFALSAQYTPEAFYHAYADSIDEELRAKGRIEYHLYKSSQISFPEASCMMISMPEWIISEDHCGSLMLYFRNLYHDRGGMDVDIRSDYFHADRSKGKERAQASFENESQKALAAYEKAQTEKAAGAQAQKKRKKSLVRSADPAMIYGKDFPDEDPVALSDLTDPGDYCVRGQIIALETRELKNHEKSIVVFTITDFTDSIRCRIFAATEDVSVLCGSLKVGAFVKLKGSASVDQYSRELSIGFLVGMKIIPDFTEHRVDTAPVKRVELHCHTKMSDMDAVADVRELIKTAKAWGHRAIAITDHGVVQAFTDAAHAVPKDDDFKIIYGCEGYLVDDLKTIVENPKHQPLYGDYVVFDLETTGFSPVENRIIEIGAVKVSGNQITDRYSTFVDPQEPIPYRITRLTSINDEMVMGAPTIGTALPDFLKFCEGCVLVAHNASFDVSFIRENAKRLGLPCDFTVMDTLSMARTLLTRLRKYTLDSVAKDLGVSLDHHHRAVDDAQCTAEIFIKMCVMLENRGIRNLDEVNMAAAMDVSSIRKLRPSHVIILAKNDIGRIHLYRLVSEAHLTYFHKKPLIPKSLLAQYREGLILSSACASGELYDAVVRGASDEELTRIASFYDYLEIQPVGNNAFLIESSRNEIRSFDEIRNLNRRVVELGEKLHKPVCATCDVHFLNPEDEIYRRIILAGQKFKDAEHQPPLYLHTTNEMLEEFSYLGEEKAYEVVVTNPNRIADMCERISPVRPDKCPPVIEDSDVTLRKICYDKAHEIYGEQLPDVVTERLERELHSIISNGFAVMYIIAQKLVWKSNEDGYLVGSRGSVGSSFVATMAGITEVNPLSPHYYCSECHYSDFTSDAVKAYAGRAGCDMPDKICPVCGAKLKKDGFDIPFETFLGFKGNKEPDIDLNFSGEYQANAHKYTEVIFGKGQTFRAGTIGTLADKTAYGYVKNYFEERGIHKRACEIDRIIAGCVGVRRTTGQHPGGIIVLPHGEDIYSFTPLQHPANDMNTDIVTTHFDYHSIDHNLLKLDILGHDDPTMIRILEDLTGIDAKTIPLDDPGVMSLFSSPEALGITAEELGCPLGCLGVPEFGTDFVIQMLQDTKPKSLSDLVRISGLSHGTDVWLGNAQTLIKEGRATISTAICTRDDIMTYLISMGLESEEAFTIMESVRKGKGLKPQWEENMKAHGVEDWYIWSCKKIKYMFPKAHAAAYVMMAWRIAWYKINEPLAYYAAYFAVRATSFDYALMAQGKEQLKHHMEDYAARKDSLTKAEQDVQKDMKNVWEMYVRGFEFTPIDIYRAKANRFLIVDGKLMPALNTIAGLGDKAAAAIEEAAREGPFLSKEDLKDRTKISGAVVASLSELGILDGMPESNQLSIFDLM